MEPDTLNFYFVFTHIDPHTIKKLENLLLFLGYKNKDMWSLQISDIGSDINAKAFYEVHLTLDCGNLKYYHSF